MKLTNLVIPPQYRALVSVAKWLAVIGVSMFVGAKFGGALTARELNAEVAEAKEATNAANTQLESCRSAVKLAGELAAERKLSLDNALATANDAVKKERESAARKVQTAIDFYRKSPPPPRAAECGPVLSEQARRVINFMQESHHAD